MLGDTYYSKALQDPRTQLGTETTGVKRFSTRISYCNTLKNPARSQHFENSVKPATIFKASAKLRNIENSATPVGSVAFANIIFSSLQHFKASAILHHLKTLLHLQHWKLATSAATFERSTHLQYISENRNIFNIL